MYWHLHLHALWLLVACALPAFGILRGGVLGAVGGVLAGYGVARLAFVFPHAIAGFPEGVLLHYLSMLIGIALTVCAAVPLRALTGLAERNQTVALPPPP
jgi:hypothetical protein